MRGLLRRRPWRSSARPFQRYDGPLHGYPLIYAAVQVSNLVSWLRFAHDCQDPALACSCAGSHRFPPPPV